MHMFQVDDEEEGVIKNFRSVLRRLKKHAIQKPGKAFHGIESNFLKIHFNGPLRLSICHQRAVHKRKIS